MGEDENDPNWFQKKVQGWVAEYVPIVLQQLGHAPGGQAPAQAAAPDYSKIQEMTQKTVAEAIQSNPDVAKVALEAQYIRSEIGKIEELREQLEQITGRLETAERSSKKAVDNAYEALEKAKAIEERLASIEEVPSKEEIEGYKQAYEGAMNAFEKMKAVFKAKDSSYQEAKTLFDKWYKSNQAREAAYQKLQSTVEELEGKVKALEDLKGGAVKLVDDKDELIPELKVPVETYVESIVDAQISEKVEKDFDTMLEKKLGIKPLALRKLIRALAKSQSIPVLEEHEHEEKAETTAEPAKKSAKKDGSSYLSKPGSPGEKPSS